MATPPVFSSGAQLTAAQMNAVGLWQITSTSLSATTVVSNCFTSDFKHYRLMVSYNCSTTAAILLRLAAGGTANNSSSYRWVYFDQYVNASSTQAPGSQSSTSSGAFNQTEWYLSNSGNGGSDCAVAWADIYNPQLAVKTSYTFQSIFEWTGPTIYNRAGGGQFNGTTQFDGFSLTTPGATTTGTVTVYGYR